MSIKLLPPEEACDTYISSDNLAAKYLEIAANFETDTQVFMTETDGLPEIQVFKGDEMRYRSLLDDPRQLESELKKVYYKYIIDDIYEEDIDDYVDDDIPYGYSDNEYDYDYYGSNYDLYNSQSNLPDLDDVAYAFRDFICAATNYDSEKTDEIFQASFNDAIQLLKKYGIDLEDS